MLKHAAHPSASTSSPALRAFCAGAWETYTPWPDWGWHEDRQCMARLIVVAQVADAEHLARNLAQAHAQRHVVARVRLLHYLPAVKALRLPKQATLPPSCVHAPMMGPHASNHALAGCSLRCSWADGRTLWHACSDDHGGSRSANPAGWGCPPSIAGAGKQRGRGKNNGTCGVSMTVRELLTQRGSLQSSFRPQPSTALRTPSPSLHHPRVQFFACMPIPSQPPPTLVSGLHP